MQSPGAGRASVLLVGAFSCASAVANDTCPVTLPAAGAIAGPFETSPATAWYGSDSLAVLIAANGRWNGMDAGHNYRNKQWWWSEGYDWRVEPELGLVVTGRRLDDESVTADVSRATNAMRDDWDGTVMLVAVEFPTTGCWQIRGEYRGQVVTFVVEVADPPAESEAERQ